MDFGRTEIKTSHHFCPSKQLRHIFRGPWRRPTEAGILLRAPSFLAETHLTHDYDGKQRSDSGEPPERPAARFRAAHCAAGRRTGAHRRTRPGPDLLLLAPRRTGGFIRIGASAVASPARPRPLDQGTVAAGRLVLVECGVIPLSPLLTERRRRRCWSRELSPDY